MGETIGRDAKGSAQEDEKISAASSWRVKDVCKLEMPVETDAPYITWRLLSAMWSCLEIKFHINITYMGAKGCWPRCGRSAPSWRGQGCLQTRAAGREGCTIASRGGCRPPGGVAAFPVNKQSFKHDGFYRRFDQYQG